MKRRLLTTVAAMGVTALTLAGCAGPGATGTPDDASGDPLTITAIYGVTGANASFVADFLEGANVAVDTINAEGGVNGRQLELTVLDDKSDPTQGVSQVQNIIASGQLPDAIFPGGTSPETLAMLPLTSSAGMFSVSSSVSPDTNKPAEYPYHFGTSPSTADQLAVLGPEMAKAGVKTLSVMVAGNASGDAGLAGIQAVADANGIEIVDVERPAVDAVSYNVEMQRMKDANPDAIYFDFTPYDAAARTMQARTAVGAADIPIYGGYGVAGVPLKTLVDAKDLEGCFVPVYRFTLKNDDMAAHLQPLYDAYEGNTTGSVYIAAYGWDVITLIATAFERAGDSIDAQSLTDSVLASDIPADDMALFLSGTEYTKDNRFPVLNPDDMSLVACGAPQIDGGLWVTE